jgi:hypothetical protein
VAGKVGAWPASYNSDLLGGKPPLLVRLLPQAVVFTFQCHATDLSCVQNMLWSNCTDNASGLRHVPLPKSRPQTHNGHIDNTNYSIITFVAAITAVVVLTTVLR